jgi:thiol-disulfide isomerase/thioredoxin
MTVRPPARVGGRLAAIAVLALVVVLACRSSRPLAASATRPPVAPVDMAQLQVLMINGGGTKSQNYQSHLLHLRGLHDVLRRAGVPAGSIALHVSDGPDPAADVALREAQPEPDFWLLEGSRLEQPLRTPVTFESSVVPGATLAAATRRNIQRWFDTTGRTLRAGDTLLLYVTDHGTRNVEDPLNNAITLWGDGERLPVKDLAAMLASLDPGVRVIALMSQCFSGGFAELARARSTRALPDGSTCGYFSSTADRPAYGCYPENRGRDNVGHSFHFIEALAERGDFPGAHEDVLVRDASPDVPLRTSDVFLNDHVQRAAAASGQDVTAYTDALLRQAWAAPESWETELRLLDRIGNAYGFAGPRSLAELERQAGRVTDVAGQLRQQHMVWQGALKAATGANLDRFLERQPVWKEHTEEARLKDLPPDTARALTAELLGAIGPATRADRGVDRRLSVLRERAQESGEVAYRMDVRDGVRLRLRTLLTSIAGRVLLAQQGSAEERAAYEALRRCEAVAIPPVPLQPELQLARPERFPAFEDDLVVATRVTPAWMGIQFRQAPEAARTAAGLAPGAASVVAVYDGSPAKEAGLRAGDIVLGPPGRHFEERDQIREWTMLSEVDEAAALDVLRDGRRIDLTLTPKPFPHEWPTLPGPPKVGSAAPPLHLGQYRGTPPSLASGKPHLLFFWATWCAVCKAALPEVAAFERERGTPVVAITDEDASRLDPFFAQHAGPFPALVATDENRQAFVAYGVSGMPTFVLVDGKGFVRGYATGYSPARGLALDGWRWAERPPAPAPRG